MILLASSIFFVFPQPLEMPRAEAYLVTGETQRLEDRFDELDLWTSRSVIGRWSDTEQRVFTLSRLDTLAPKFTGPSVTRASYAANSEPLPPKDEDLLFEAIERLSPVVVSNEPVSSRQPIRKIASVLYFPCGDEKCIVCAFRPEKVPHWYLATWELSPDDDVSVAKEKFEDDFLSAWEDLPLPSEKDAAERVNRRRSGRKRKESFTESNLLKEDIRANVTNYPSWHVTECDGFVVADDLPSDSGFVRSLTNELASMRVKYASTVPTPLDATNTLSVARIYKSRDEYLAALNVNDVSGMEWSAAYWSAARRELVAYLPMDGDRELLKTFRHEAFHQYLSYACSMIPASPWFNEGYAQYFEDENSDSWGVDADIDALAEMLPSLLAMNYAEFYAGTGESRHLKYRMAWSIAYFLEKGADEIRFRPFAGLKRDYVDYLLKSQDMVNATFEAFGGSDKIELFVSEWKKFWKKRKGW